MSPIIQDILAASGYDNQFCGQLLSIQSLLGIGFLILSSYSVLIVKNSAIGCKLLACPNAICFLLYLYSIQLRNSKGMILSASLLSMFVRNLAMPSLTNMSAHLCSGIVREATIQGLAMVPVCVLSSIFSLVVVYLRTKIHENEFSYTGKLIVVKPHRTKPNQI